MEQKINLPQLNLPPCNLQLRPDDDSRRGGVEVYDRLRRRWVALTPEEYVRQCFVNFMLDGRAFPEALMANEVELKLNRTSRRCDTVVYTSALRPLCIVEYKAPHIAITQRVFDQIARYNSVLNAPFLVVSNGLNHFCCRFTGAGYVFLPDIPAFAEMMKYAGASQANSQNM